MWRKPRRKPDPHDLVYVIRYGDKYMLKCRHAYCPPWGYLSDKCVACFRQEWRAQWYVSRLAELGVYPEGLKIKATIEHYDRWQVGKAPQGTDTTE